MNNQQMIKSAQNMTIGTNYKVVQKSAIYTDNRGFPRKDVFKAVEFTNQNGEQKFIGELFL